MKNVIEQLCILDGETGFAEEKSAYKTKPSVSDAYEKMCVTLSEEQKPLFDALCKEFDFQCAQESEIYYKMGIKTGFALAKELYG